MSDKPRARPGSLLALVVLAGLLGLAQAPYAAADAPVAIPFEESFVGVNPCTGDDHTITVTGTFFVFERGQGISHRLQRTITTSDGFSGHGTEISVDHDRMFVIHDVLQNGSGGRIRAQLVLVHDASGTLRVERFDVTCV